jgi:MinD superfamily P-loop ATPase
VTEPTPFGLHDLKLAVDVVRKMQIPCGVVVNRADCGDGNVQAFCKQQHIPILLNIPFSREIASAYSRGISLVEHAPAMKDEFKKMYNRIKDICYDI